MAPTVDYATLIILDVGRNVAAQEDCKENSFFDDARQCALRIIERNIMIKTANHVGIVLLGSNKTKNALAEQCKGAFKHIELRSSLQVPTWDMIRNLPDSTTNRAGDWFESLIVAAHHFKEEVSGVKITSKKIVLITNFESPAKVSNMLDDVVTGFQEENFEVYVIGPDLETSNSRDIELVKKFLTATNGDTATFEDAMRGWLFHKTKSAKIRPQHFNLSIGPNIHIPVALYIRVRDEPVVKNWQKAIKDPVTLQPSTTEGVGRGTKIIGQENQLNEGDNHKTEDTSNGEKMPPRFSKDDIIQGYQYGQKVIPFSESDKAMLYKSGEKSISIYGFTDASNINWQNLHGPDGTYYLLARKDDKKAEYAITCLVQCLQELNLVGVVRKVYSKVSEPKMYVLIPVIDKDNFIGLSLINICYKEDIKHMAFPPTELKKYETSQEQVSAFKDLIAAMDLTKAYGDDNFDDTEAFPVAETVSPSIQYMLDCIAFRAMNPEKPLPQPRDEIMTLFKNPPLIEKRSREPIEKLKKLFTLTKVESKKGSRKRGTQISLPQNDQTNDVNTDQHMPQVQLPILKRDDITTIGTVNPVNDFNILKEKGKSLFELSTEIVEVIENLVYTNFGGDFTKAIDAMRVFREECVKEDPSLYNNWLQKFKKDLLERKRDNFLGLISEMKLNLIINDENSASSFTAKDTHDESQMYEVDTVPNSTELTIRSDVNDLFDEM